jgi:UrcA family protein
MNRLMQFWYRILITLPLFLAAQCPLIHAAEQAVNAEPSIAVKFSDLDLNTDAGRRELLNRLGKATEQVCSESARSLEYVAGSEAWRSCYRRTLAAAVNRLHHKQVSALFAAVSRPNAR